MHLNANHTPRNLPLFSTHSWICYVWCLTGLRMLVDEGLPPHSPRHRAPSWGRAMRGWAGMRACGRAHGWSELWEAGDQPCYSVTRGPGGPKWGPGTGAGWVEPWGAKGAVRPIRALRAATPTNKRHNAEIVCSGV